MLAAITPPSNPMTNQLRIRRAPAPHWVGDGFPVHSLFSYTDGPSISPFLLLDYASPHSFPPRGTPRGVGPHPHRGFETVTICFAGEVAHRDSAGNGGIIGPGDVQWMTAGAGLVHEEMHSDTFTATGGELEMVQLWVNLPARDKRTKPAYQDLRAAAMPAVELADGAGTVRVIAGEYEGARGPARTFTPIELWSVRLREGGQLPLLLPAHYTKMVLVRRGQLTVDGGEAIAARELAQLPTGADSHSLEATAPDTECVVLAGEPIDEPVVGHGPFVMNTQQEIVQAMRDFQAGRMGVL